MWYRMTFLLCAMLAAACAGPRPGPATPIVKVSALDEDAGDDFVLEIPAGTRLPVDVRLAAPFARTEQSEPAFTLVFDKTVFWYARNPTLLSFDGVRWQRVSDLYRGRLEAGLSRRAGGGPRGVLALELKPR